MIYLTAVVLYTIPLLLLLWFLSRH